MYINFYSVACIHSILSVHVCHWSKGFVYQAGFCHRGYHWHIPHCFCKGINISLKRQVLPSGTLSQTADGLAFLSLRIHFCHLSLNVLSFWHWAFARLCLHHVDHCMDYSMMRFQSIVAWRVVQMFFYSDILAAVAIFFLYLSTFTSVN